MITLLGMLVVVVGFALRANPLLVVVAGGLTTGVAAGFSFNEVVAMIGQFFTDNRALMLPIILMVPIVGVLERHGLQERVAMLIQRATAATAGRVLWGYQLLRGFTSMFGLSIGNHAAMVRPLIAPMAEGAALVRSGTSSPQSRDEIRAHAAAAGRDSRGRDPDGQPGARGDSRADRGSGSGAHIDGAEGGGAQLGVLIFCAFAVSWQLNSRSGFGFQARCSKHRAGNAFRLRGGGAWLRAAEDYGRCRQTRSSCDESGASRPHHHRASWASAGDSQGSPAHAVARLSRLVGDV